MEKLRPYLGVLGILAVALVALGLVMQSFSPQGRDTWVPISQVVEDVRAGRIDKVTVFAGDGRLAVEYGNGVKRQSRMEPGTTALEYFRQAGIAPNALPQIEVQSASQFPSFITLLATLLPVALVIAVLAFFFTSSRQQQNSDPKETYFSKSRARMIKTDRPTTLFTDVAGVEEAKQELEEVVEFLKRPARFLLLGARVPRGVLLVGPPGTGKTLIARAVAGEAGVPFFSISGSEFVEMYVGVGAARVRDLFDQAKKQAPSIIFIDEIDAVGRQRGAGLGGGHDEREQTLNQILVEMDGFDNNTNVIVIAATNRPDILDPALIRPGRFDRQVTLDRPDMRGRQAILEVHSKGKPLAPSVTLNVLAKQTSGFSGAELANVINEAAILAARRDHHLIELDDLEEAVDRVVAGPARKSRLISERERTITAYHEVGHALVARLLPNVDPVHKISIVSRGSMGGYTRILPTEDRYLYSRSHFYETIVWALGGYAAEEIMFSEVTTGASNDIERASDIARRMVTQYGMSAKLGPIAFGEHDEMSYYGRDSDRSNYSGETAHEIDGEIRQLMQTAYEQARNLLVEYREILIRVSEILLEREVIEGEELERAFGLPEPKQSPTLHIQVLPLLETGLDSLAASRVADQAAITNQQPSRKEKAS